MLDRILGDIQWTNVLVSHSCGESRVAQRLSHIVGGKSIFVNLRD